MTDGINDITYDAEFVCFLLSENTVRSRLRLIPEELLIENRQKGRKYYLLDLDAADKIFED